MSGTLDTVLSIDNIRLKAYHGWYAAERKLGGIYSISVKVHSSIGENEHFEDLEESVNYEHIYKIVADTMAEEYKLIETCCKALFERLKPLKPNAVWEIHLIKENPPMKFVGATSFRIKA